MFGSRDSEFQESVGLEVDSLCCLFLLNLFTRGEEEFLGMKGIRDSVATPPSPPPPHSPPSQRCACVLR